LNPEESGAEKNILTNDPEIAAKDDYNTPWKDILENYFFEFLEFFFPEAYRDIDRSRGYRFLDKELKQVVRDAELGRRYADKLAEVFLKDGSKEWILIHVEVQGRKEKVFAERMFVYNYRIFDKYRRTVISFAVLADDNAGWRPSGFGYGRWGCMLRMDFPIVKLTDYAAQWEELEKSENPFAVAVMAHLKAIETKKDRNQRRYWKLHLCKSLYSRGYSRNDVLLLFGFIDWLMTLPEEAEELFLSEMQAFEEERKMPYITSAERIGIKKGIEQGILLGIDQGVRQGLEKGLEQGLEKGLEQSIRRLLLKGIGPEETARLLDADKKTVLRILREIRKSES
jgi:hypothetical protein